ncbi:MAG: sulfatase-like hydrolase/transferase, partial [Myxococcota bacterium]
VLPRPGAPSPPSSGPSVLVVTVDGLGADAVPAELTALTAGGVTFTDAVTPTPAGRPANAAVLTGVHPLRNGVLTERDRLSRAFPTLFEALATAGWDTGAFVSTATVDRRSGLAQGFRTFDDGWTGAQDAAVARIGLGLFTRAADPLRIGRWSAREDRATASAFARWASHRDTPWAAWVHLSDPHRVALGALGQSTLAEAAATLRTALDPAVMLVVVGTHGELPGGRGNATLADGVVHVPLAVRPPTALPAPAVVGAQVRTLDVAATVLDALDVDAGTETEGLPLAGYATGARQVSLSCSLVGQDLDGGWLVGLRADRVKVITGPGDAARLYLLDEDPAEAVDRSAEQPGVMAQARGAIAADRAALDARLR